MLFFSFTRYSEAAMKEGFVCSGSSFKHFKQPQRKVTQIKLCLGPGWFYGFIVLICCIFS